MLTRTLLKRHEREAFLSIGGIPQASNEVRKPFKLAICIA